jgi:hypothetical protein
VTTDQEKPLMSSTANDNRSYTDRITIPEQGDGENDGVTDHEIAVMLSNLLYSADSEAQNECADIERVTSFEDGGVLTMNAGLTLRLADGTEFQVTIVRSR